MSRITALPPRLLIRFPRVIRSRWETYCRSVFPLEAYGFLIGETVGNVNHVEDLWLPTAEQHAKQARPDCIAVPEGWGVEALEAASDEGLYVLGDIHSHPLPYATHRGEDFEAVPSEGDYRHGWPGLCGITSIRQTQSGRLYTRTRFYGPTAKITIL